MTQGVQEDVTGCDGGDHSISSYCPDGDHDNDNDRVDVYNDIGHNVDSGRYLKGSLSLTFNAQSL